MIGVSAIMVFLLALLIGAGALWLWWHAESRSRTDEVALRLRLLGDDANAELAPRITRQGDPGTRLVVQLLWRAGIELPPERVTRSLLAAVAIVPLVLLIFGFLAGALVLALVTITGFAVLSRNAARRRRKIVEQLPAFLEGVIRVLGVGNTLEESIGAAARESPDPIRPLFVSIGRQIRLGAPIEVVLAEAGEVHRLRDLKVIALAASINRKYGGSLRQVIKSLISSIRQRDVAARELRALTAETRFSALVLGIIPVTLSLYIFTRNKAYYADMWADSAGKWFLVASVALQIVGVAVLWRMMNVTEDPDA